MSADDASSYLISTLQGFQMGADQAEEIVDKYNKVANNFAIDTRGIGEALQRSAASFNAANTDLSKSIALVTSANEVVQNPEVVGTMFKTLSARIRGAKTELSDLGEEEDEFTESTSKLQKLVKSLTGFDIMKDKDTFKDVYDILLGIGKEWDNLTDIEQASLGEALAGKRNANALYAVLGNLDTLEDAYKAAENSAGSAAREQENYAQSIQYSIDRVKASLEELSYDFLESDMVKNAIEFANGALQFLDKVIEKVDSLPGIIAGIGTAIASLKIGGKINAESVEAFTASLKSASHYIAEYNRAMDFNGPITEEFIENMGIADESLKQHLVNSLEKGKTSLLEFKAAQLAVTIQTAALEAGLMALKALISVGVSFVVSALVTKITEWAEASEKARKAAISDANVLREQSAELNEQIEKYKELHEQLEDTTLSEDKIRDIKERLVDIQKELNDKYGDEAGKIDLVNGKYERQLELLNAINESEARNYLLRHGEEYEEAQERISKRTTGHIAPKEGDRRFKEFAQKYGLRENADQYGYVLSYSFDFEIGEAEDKLNELLMALGKLQDETGIDYSEQINQISAYLDKLENNEKLQESKKIVEEYTTYQIAANKLWASTYADATQAVEDYNKALASGEGIDKAAENLQKAKDAIAALVFKDDEANVKNAFDAIFEGINESYQKAYESEQKLRNALGENNTILGQSLGYLQKYNLKEDDFIGGLGGIDENARASMMTILAQLGYTQDELDDVIALLVKIGVIEGNITQESENTFDSARIKAYVKTLNEVSAALMKGTELTQEQLAALRQPFDELVKIFPQLKDDISVLNEEFLQGTNLWADALANVKNAINELSFTKLQEEFNNASEGLKLPVRIDNEAKAVLRKQLKELGEGGNVDLTVRPVIPADWLNQLGWDAGEGSATVFSSTYTNKDKTIAMNFTPIITDENGNYITAFTPEELEEYAEGVINGVHTDNLNLKIGTTYTGKDAVQKAEAAAEKIHELHEKYFLDKTYQIPIEINDDNFEEFKASFNDFIEADKNITIAVNADISDNFKTITDNLNDINTAAALVEKNFKVSYDDLANLSSVFPGILEGMTVLKDGSVQLNKEVAQAAIQAVKDEANADAESVLQRIRIQRILAETKAKTYGEMAEAAAVLAGEEVDSEMDATKARARINAGYEEIQQINAQMTANEVNTQQKNVADASEKNSDIMSVNYASAAGSIVASMTAMANAGVTAMKNMAAGVETGNQVSGNKSLTTGTYSGSSGYYNETDLLAKTKAALEDTATLQQEYMEELREGFLNAQSVSEKVAKTYLDMESQIMATMQFTEANLTNVQNGKAGSTKPESLEDKKDEYKEVIDYFEKMVKVIDNSISLLEAHLEDVVGSAAKNTLLSASQDLIQSKLNGYASAVEMYTQKAEEALAKVPADIAEKIINGAVDIDTFIDKNDEEVVKAINDYQTWADKVNDARLQLVQLKETLRQLELQKFNNLLEDFNNQIDLRQSSGIDLISKQIDLLKEAGQLIGESFYQKQIELTRKNLATLEDARSALAQQMNEALDNGIDVGSDEWLEMVRALTEVESKILDAKKALEEFDNALLELHTEVFNMIQDQFDSYENELSNLRGLFSEDKVADENGEWTKEGLAQLGLLGQEYELAKYRVEQYNKEIAKLNADYKAGKYSASEYAEKLAELKQRQWENVNAAEEAKKAMLDLNKARIEQAVAGINKEIEAYEELIKKQKELLSAEKDLHDYQKSIAESEKDIVALQRQLAAMANDDSEAARAKRLKLEEELAKKQEELAEKQYDHNIDQQQDALDKELENYKDAREKEIEELEKSLEDIERIIAESFEAIRENASLIGDTITQEAQEHGVEVSDALIEAWQHGEDSIAKYGEALSAGTSAFIGNIGEVEHSMWDLQNQANSTADDLVDMFATRADNLVDELVRAQSYEQNVDAVTNALHNSLTSTIDGHYAGTQVKNALDGMKNAADELTRSLEKARQAMIDLLNQQSQPPKYHGAIYELGPDGEYHYIGTGEVSGENIWQDPNSGRIYVDKEYARGSKKILDDQLAWTQEQGAEMIISPTSGAILTPLRKGDAVIPADMTSNLWEWGGFNPEEFAKNLLESTKIPESSNVTTNTMQVGSLVTVNGNVNDSMEMMQIASQTASSKIKQSFKELSKGLNK